MTRRNLGILADLAVIVSAVVLALWALGVDIPLDIRL